jgi:hypothetical protein
MKTKEFKIKIDAPREKVWKILWEDKSYREWTKPFSETSYAQTDWKKGSKVLFHDGKGNGMVSTIADNRPNEFMSIKHLGIVKNGVEDLESPEVKQWAGSMENYSLKDMNGNTELTVHMDMGEIDQQMLDFFMNAWPKALERVKDLSEKN